MRSNIVLWILTLLASAACWWPAAVEPSLDSIVWVAFAIPALCAGLSSAMSQSRWPLFMLASTAGTFGGLCAGLTIWRPSDPIAGASVPYGIALFTLAAGLTSLVACLVGRKGKILNQRYRSAVWVALFASAAFGPIALAVTPPLVSRRIARNDRAAEARFAALRSAVARTAAESGDPRLICDGSLLQRNYSGPPFSGVDWLRITGNYVSQDGYSYMVYCREKGNGYTIVAQPKSEMGYGTRHFCADESGNIRCRMEWNRSRYACLPCTK